jgi:CBS domain containing-hemolysin-like protein
VLGRLGHIPHVGETIEDEESGIRLEVITMNRLRIERVALSKI